MEYSERISNLLMAMRTDAIQVSKALTDESWHQLMSKYDVLFLGEKINTVYAREVYSCLIKPAHIDISLQDFLALIPSVCRNLSMKAEPMVSLKDINQLNPPIGDYSIELF